MKAVYWFKTGLLFAVLTLILVLIGSVVGAIFGDWRIGFVVMLAISVLMNVVSVVFSKKMALRAHKVHLVTYDEEPRLYSIVQRLSEKAGLPMPQVGVSELPMPNAWQSSTPTMQRSTISAAASKNSPASCRPPTPATMY